MRLPAPHDTTNDIRESQRHRPSNLHRRQLDELIRSDWSDLPVRLLSHGNRMHYDHSQIQPSWLVEQIPTFDAALAGRVDLRHAGVPDVAVESILAKATAASRREWDSFIAAASAGDALWYFRTPRETWNERAGRAGFVLVRAGVPIAAVATSMS